MAFVSGVGGTIVTGKEDIALVRLMALENAMRFEAKTGMQMTRGRSAYSIIKQEFGFKGNKQKVADQMTAYYNEKKEERLNKPVDPKIVEKLHPKNFSEMSGKFAAIVAYILGVTWTGVEFDAIMVTSDGMVLGQFKDDVGMNEFIGAYSDLKRNWDTLLKAAGLTSLEHDEATERFNKRIAGKPQD